jgi:hypothetical protein
MLELLNNNERENSKNLMIKFFIVIGIISLYPLSSNNVKINEKIFISIWTGILTIFLLIGSLLLNKGYFYSHSLFWFFYLISIFFIKSYEGKIFLLILSVSVIMCWHYYTSLGKSGCPLLDLYDRSNYNTSVVKYGSMVNNLIYVYTIYLLVDLVN